MSASVLKNPDAEIRLDLETPYTPIPRGHFALHVLKTASSKKRFFGTLSGRKSCSIAIFQRAISRSTGFDVLVVVAFLVHTFCGFGLFSAKLQKCERWYSHNAEQYYQTDQHYSGSDFVQENLRQNARRNDGQNQQRR